MLKKLKMNDLAILFILLVFAINNTYAQEKFEKEYRIKEEAVPQEALEFINSAGFTKRVKWYKEEGLKRHTIEAKTNHNGVRYSIEFDATGKIEDIEYKIKWENIPSVTRSNIDAFLDAIYQKKRLFKVQIQLVGNKEELLKALVKSKSDAVVDTKYEIVLKGKTGGKYEMLEYLFSEKGEMERKSTIILKNTDNLEY